LRNWIDNADHPKCANIQNFTVPTFRTSNFHGIGDCGLVEFCMSKEDRQFHFQPYYTELVNVQK